MIHRTFRSLDEAPKLVGFTIRQWAALICTTGILAAIIQVAHVSVKPAITLLVFTVGLPAALTYVSETGGLQLGLLLRDMARWRLGPKNLTPYRQTDRAAAGVLIAGGPERDETATEQPRAAHARGGAAARRDA